MRDLFKVQVKQMYAVIATGGADRCSGACRGAASTGSAPPPPPSPGASMSTATYARVEHALRRLDCDIGAAECHGMLCGMLSASRVFARDAWLRAMGAALDRADVEPDVRAFLDEKLADVASFLRNAPG